jgi:signal transduction histidine kinase
MEDENSESSADIQSTIDTVIHQIICLRQAAKLLAKTSEETHEVLYALVHMLPEGLQYPEITCARIVLEDLVVKSENFKETDWVLSSDIFIGEEISGLLEVRYLEEKEELEHGPFLMGERSLLETVAMELGAFLEHKRTDRLKQQQHRELELYASLLRHDLRNDVAVIIGNVEIFRMVNPDADEVMQEIIKSTEAVCERMMGVLAAFGRSAKMSEIHITKLIENTASQAQEVNKELTINFNMEENSDRLRIPESRLLPMVFDNLFRNVVIHAGETATIDVSVKKEKMNVEIVISDDGPGVSPEIIDRLFEKGASSRGGGGLGLHLSKVVIESMGGTIELAASSRKGATFRIQIPLVV